METILSFSILGLSLALGISICFNIIYNQIIQSKKLDMKDLERSNYKMKSEILFLNSEISSLKKRMEYQKKLLRDNNYFIPTNDFVAKEDSSNNQIINNNQLTLPTINSEIRNY